MYFGLSRRHSNTEWFREEAARSRGFTIVELLVVIVVIAILASISVTSYNGIQQRATWTRAQAEVKSVASTLEMYRIDNSAYPLTYAEFKVPVQAAGLWEPGRSPERGYVYCGDANTYYLIPHTSLSLISGTLTTGAEIRSYSSTSGWGQYTHTPNAFPGGNFQQNACANIMPGATLRLWMHDSTLSSV